MTNSARWRGYLWLAVCVLAGIVIIALFTDSYQQDGGNHYVYSRWAWVHHELFVGVWTRPLFEFLYAFPALVNYRLAKFCTVIVCVLTAWQTWRVARFYELERSELVILFLLAQPVFFLLWADTMTEPLFALVFVTALDLHLKGRVKLGAFVASLMLLARPEGFFLGAMWGFWLLFDRRLAANIVKRVPWTLILASGGIIWVLVSWLLTGDILYIKHYWPHDWNATGSTYGSGPIWDYVVRLPEIVGPIMMVPFLVGLFAARWKYKEATISVLTLFAVHSIFRVFGMFGSAGYARYFICVGPAIAILTLVGWNQIAAWLRPVGGPVRAILGSLVIVASIAIGLLYTDACGWNRDARAVDEMNAWWKQNQRPVTKLIYSQAYQNIVIDRDPWEKPNLGGDREENLKILKAMPSGTLIFWDGQTGPSWYKLTADDIEAAGYTRLRSQNYVLRGYWVNTYWYGYGGVRNQEMHLLYKQ